MNRKNKDYLYAIFLVLTHFALWYYFSYIKYANVDIKDYKYIFGLPEWFFYSSVVTSIIIIILLILFCREIFNNKIEDGEDE